MTEEVCYSEGGNLFPTIFTLQTSFEVIRTKILLLADVQVIFAKNIDGLGTKMKQNANVRV